MRLKGIFLFVLVIVLLALTAIYTPYLKDLTGNTIKSDVADYPKEQAILLRVIDGDTIRALVNGTEETIRMLGINTPEKGMPFSEQSAGFLKRFVNKTIILERDWEDTDKYKRKLRYVFVDNRFLNLEIVENGFANIYYYSGLKYEEHFISAEMQARNLETGFWKKSQEKCSIDNCLILKELNYTAELFIIKNTCNYKCDLTGWFVRDAGRNVIYLSNLSSEEEKVYKSKTGSDVWNNKGDKFFLFDKKGYLVLFYEY